jgi:hypothetical protein
MQRMQLCFSTLNALHNTAAAAPKAFPFHHHPVSLCLVCPCLHVTFRPSTVWMRCTTYQTWQQCCRPHSHPACMCWLASTQTGMAALRVDLRHTWHQRLTFQQQLQRG